MDSVLTEFIQRTHADPALARDLLEATEWNVDAAEAAYHSLQDTHTVDLPDYEYNPKDFESILPGIPESGEGGDGGEGGDSGDEGRAARKRQRKKRGRGLSFLAEDVIDKFNKVAVSKLRVSSEEQVTIDEQFFHHSFVYPDFSAEQKDLQEFIAADLLEVSHKRALERSGRLNWWTTGKLPRLEPLATSGDGNCLLHAASIYMWGFHDRELILRTALHRLLTSGVEKPGLLSRWKYQTQLRNDQAGGLTFSPEEWEFEWAEIVRIATSQPRRQPVTASLRRYSSLRYSYESLEEVHVLAVAHVLRRAIIVISDKTIKNMSGEDLAPIYFGGIYLPLEVRPSACHKSPLVLAYDSSHFSPLVAREVKQEKQQLQKSRSKMHANVSGRIDTVIPLVTPDGELLPVQFIYNPDTKGVREKWAKMEYAPGEFPDDIVQLLESYLDIRWIKLDDVTNKKGQATQSTVVSDSTDDDYDHLFPVKVPKVRFPAARMLQEAQPIYQKDLIDKYLETVRERFQEEKDEVAKREEERVKRERQKPVPCVGEGCDLFGTLATDSLCSRCYHKQQSTTDTTDDSGKINEPLPAYENKDNHKAEVIIPSPVRDREPDKPVLVADSAKSSTYISTFTEEDQGDVKSFSKSYDNVIERRKAPPPPPSKSKTLEKNATPATPNEEWYKTAPSSNKQPTPKPPINSPSRAQSTAVANSSSSSSSGTPKPTPVKPDKISWAKKLHVPNIGGLNFTKSKKTHQISSPTSSSASGGYSRDNIQPISLSSQSPAPQPRPPAASSVGGASREPCVSSGCEFFGSADRDGYCSSCYKEIQKRGPTTVV